MRRFPIVGRAVMAAILGSAAPACSDAAQPLSITEFRDRYVEDFARRHPGVAVRAAAEDVVEVGAPGEPPHTTYLRRAYDVYREHPEELASVFATLNAGFDQSDMPATAENILVLVRPTTFSPDPDNASRPLLSRPLGAGLMAVVAIDAPANYIYAPAEDLRADMKAEDAAIWAKALENTRRHLTKRPRPPAMGRPVTFTTGEGMASSLLFEDAFWDSPAMTAAGPIVVSPMGKDFLMLALQSDAGAVAKMREVLSNPDPDPEKLAYILMVRKDGRWLELP